MFDVGRRGFCDLSSMFSQKTSLYQDPNASQTYSGGFDLARETEPDSYQSKANNDSYQQNSYQNEFFDQFEAKESRPKLKTQHQEHSSLPKPKPTAKAAKPKESTSLLTSNLSSSSLANSKGVSKEEALLGDLAGRPVMKKKNAKSAEDDVWNMLNESSTTKKSSSRRKQ